MFRLLGIPVRVDPWFLLGLFFVSTLAGGGRAGLLAAVALGVFTLVHELGHALTARRLGLPVTITLNFLVGWATYGGGDRLVRRQRVAISAMGSLTQIAAALPVLWLVRSRADAAVNAGDRAAALLAADVWTAVVWGGLLIALLNLLPLWPLDGGTILADLLGGRNPARARRAVAFGTLVVCGLMVVAQLVQQSGNAPAWIEAERLRSQLATSIVDVQSGTLRGPLDALVAQIRAIPGLLLAGPWFVLLFCGFAAVQELSAGRRRLTAAAPVTASLPRHGEPTGPARRRLATEAEHQAWVTGQPGRFPPGFVASPWWHAAQRLAAGDRDGAALVLAGATAAGRPEWLLPDEVRDLAAPLAALLPAPLPVGDPERTLLALDLASRSGTDAEALLRDATSVYQATGDPGALWSAAAALARLGHHDDALSWLARAVAEDPDAGRLASDPRLRALHPLAGYQRLLAAVRSNAG